MKTFTKRYGFLLVICKLTKFWRLIKQKELGNYNI